MSAHYFDGRNARLHPVRLAVDAGMLLVSGTDLQRSYPLGTVALSEPFAAAPAVLRFGDGASCEVAGDSRQPLLDALGYRKSRVVRWQERWPAALLALVLLTALLAALYFRGVPAVAAFVADRLPLSADTSLGRAALASLEKQAIMTPSRLSDERLADVQALLPLVTPPRPRVPLRLLVRASNRLGANALALPDGTIIVTDGLVRLFMNKANELDDEGKASLIAVLGHEVGHVQKRHAARTMARSSLTAAFSAVLFGDFSAVAAGLPAVLSQMEYSRAMELEADDYGVWVLDRNGLEAAELAYALQALEDAAPESEGPRWLSQSMSYLSTHPSTAERIRRLEAPRQ